MDSILVRMSNQNYHKTTFQISDAFAEYMDDRNIASRHLSTDTSKI
jgi:hypothetical protein